MGQYGQAGTGMNRLNNCGSLQLLSNHGITMQIGGHRAVVALVAQGEDVHQAGL